MSSQTFVFINYFGGSSGSWQWVINHLHKDISCLAIRLPGFEGDPAPDDISIKGYATYILSVLAEKNIKSYSLIGHSMGGKIAMLTAALSDKDAVKNLVLIAPSPPTFEEMPENEKRRMLKHPDIREAKKTVRNGTVAALSEEKFDYAVNSQLIIDKRVWKWWLLVGMLSSIRKEVTNLKCPILLLDAMEDPVITPTMIQHEILPYLNITRRITLSECGHLIPMERSKKTAEILNTLYMEGLF